MTMRLLPQLMFLGIYFWNFSSAQVCSSGWFGSKCQFKCHCVSSCDPNGLCPANSKCMTGWFGNACQYQDLASVGSTIIKANPIERPPYTWVTDRDDATCNQDIALQSIEVTFNTILPVTWLRITLSDSGDLGSLNVSLTRLNGKIECIDKTIYLINSKTVDIRCHVIVDATSVIIEGQGIKSLCSLYISGGRNVALRQSATQSSTYTGENFKVSASNAYNAVDGNTDGHFLNFTCTHTEIYDTNPSWNVTFDHTQILSRIVLYNRIDTTCPGFCGRRLNSFNLQCFDPTNTLVFNYKDTSTDTTETPVFTVILTETASTTPVSRLGISLNKPSSILALCEVEAYGDCVPGKWGPECSNTCNMNCSSTCNVDTGSCQVCNGFVDPPNCKKECATGTWGINCTNVCSNSCWENSCNSIEGLCDRGCKGSREFPNCNQACIQGTWGLNCGQMCNINCLENSCNSATGVCDKACIGFKDFPTCSIVCDPTTWGANCTSSCHASCFNSSCDRISGLCNQGCNGYTNPPNCTKVCNPGNWGPNCTLACKSSCFNSSCDRFTGLCNNDCNGYSDPPQCTKECDKGEWGRDCSNTCNTSCWNNSCNHVSGVCDQGCNGYSDFPSCTRECLPVMWGVNCSTPCNHCLQKSCSSINAISEKSETSPYNSMIGVGVGLGISCAVNIALIIVIFMLMRRWKHPSNTGKTAKNKDRDESYDNVRIGNADNHEYQRPVTASCQQNSRIKIKTDVGDEKEKQSNPRSSNVYNEIIKATSEYETIGI